MYVCEDLNAILIPAVNLQSVIATSSKFVTTSHVNICVRCSLP